MLFATICLFLTHLKAAFHNYLRKCAILCIFECISIENAKFAFFSGPIQFSNGDPQWRWARNSMIAHAPLVQRFKSRPTAPYCSRPAQPETLIYNNRQWQPTTHFHGPRGAVQGRNNTFDMPCTWPWCERNARKHILKKSP